MKSFAYAIRIPFDGRYTHFFLLLLSALCQFNCAFVVHGACKCCGAYLIMNATHAVRGARYRAKSQFHNRDI